MAGLDFAMRSSRLVGWVEVVDDPPREKESFAPLVDMMIAQDLAAGHSREEVVEM